MMEFLQESQKFIRAQNESQTIRFHQSMFNYEKIFPNQTETPILIIRFENGAEYHFKDNAVSSFLSQMVRTQKESSFQNSAKWWMNEAVLKLQGEQSRQILYAFLNYLYQYKEWYKENGQFLIQEQADKIMELCPGETTHFKYRQRGQKIEIFNDKHSFILTKNPPSICTGRTRFLHHGIKKYQDILKALLDGKLIMVGDITIYEGLVKTLIRALNELDRKVLQANILRDQIKQEKQDVLFAQMIYGVESNSENQNTDNENDNGISETTSSNDKVFSQQSTDNKEYRSVKTPGNSIFFIVIVFVVIGCIVALFICFLICRSKKHLKSITFELKSFKISQ